MLLKWRSMMGKSYTQVMRGVSPVKGQVKADFTPGDIHDLPPFVS
jgi:hypothetical protein